MRNCYTTANAQKFNFMIKSNAKQDTQEYT